ncbi:hypothetical protein [Brevundimonas sp. A19_0]|uniref:hypothetical protein n=1 Tax=Brevundimonas sp. A19_0 TaxID=2821087 RepID=UPI001ADA2262|nr:hypothetical protein [Brevundimonas sp. A19_0]MBO9502330.1 hypothetical protein [Brevundimonas sp. A19_0]
MKTFDITEALAEPFRQAMRRPMATLVWGLVSLLPSIGGIALMFHLFGSEMFFEPDVQGVEDLQAFFQFQSWSMMVNLLEWLGSIVVITAVTRATFAVRRRDSAFFLRVGWDELWVLVASLVVAIVAVIAVLILAALAIGLGVAIWQLPELARGFGYLILGVAVLLAILLAAGRAYLILPACVWHHKLAFEEGWKLGRGNTWRLAGLLIMVGIVSLVMSLVLLVVGVILLMIVGAVLGGWSAPAIDDPEAWFENIFEQPMIWVTVGVIMLIPLAWAQGFFQLLGNAPFAHVVRELSTDTDMADSSSESV